MLLLQLPPVGFAGPEEAGEEMLIPHLQEKTANIRGWTSCSSLISSHVTLGLSFLSIWRMKRRKPSRGS